MQISSLELRLVSLLIYEPTANAINSTKPIYVICNVSNTVRKGQPLALGESEEGNVISPIWVEGHYYYSQRWRPSLKLSQNLPLIAILIDARTKVAFERVGRESVGGNNEARLTLGEQFVTKVEL